MTRQTRGGMDLVRISGIQVAIDYSWLIIFVLVLWSLSAGYFPARHPGYSWLSYTVAGLAATLLFFLSVLVHELSHALVANRMGQQVRRITLFIFGGMAHLSGEPHSPAAEFKIAAVGPLTSVALGGLFWGVARSAQAAGLAGLWSAVFGYLAFINVALAIFNLLPGFPLDGGRLLRAWFWKRTGDRRTATSRAADWGSGIAIGLMVLGALQIFGGALVGGLWLIFIGMFLRGAARASYYGVVVEHALGRTRVRDIMVRDPVVISGDASVSEAIEAYFLRYGFGGFPVVTNSAAEGLLSLPLVQTCPREEREQRRVRDIMRPLDERVAISSDASVSEALRKMVENDLGRLLVLDRGRLDGVITRTGITRYIQFKTSLDESEQG